MPILRRGPNFFPQCILCTIALCHSAVKCCNINSMPPSQTKGNMAEKEVSATDRSKPKRPDSKRKPGPDTTDPEEVILRKRLPKSLPRRKNDVYVNRRTDFAAQLQRCTKLLDSGYDEVFIHGLGAAVNRAVNLALKLKQNGLGSIDVATQTSTVELIDDFEPEADDFEGGTQFRNNSAVHIRVFRTVQTSDKATRSAAGSRKT